MGSVSNSRNADADNVVAEPAGEGMAPSDPGSGEGVDAANRRRDNSAGESDDWLAAGLEEAGYGYGV